MEFKSIENLWTNHKAGEPEHLLTPQEWENIQKGIAQLKDQKTPEK